jgi:sodium transport system permease protein
MNWSNIRLIFLREMRDQLRDRRTLFMIAVLPVLLYPLMGLSFLQVAQFLQEHPTKVGLIGFESLPAKPPLIAGDRFVPGLFSRPERTRLLEVEQIQLPASTSAKAWAQQSIANGQHDVVVYFPPRFGEQLAEYTMGSSPQSTAPPQPQLFFSGAKDRSRVAYERSMAVLDRWRSQFVEKTLKARHVPPAAAEPFKIGDNDVAELSGRRAATWSKILPFVLIVWALTGAFYPAIDLCAGEKERGTLETLLCSPAERQEIVWGKLLTVTLFSVTTSLLNLISMTATGTMILSRMEPPEMVSASTLGPPPVSTMMWMVVALIPLAAMFSALSLALAAMARSTKEGQYYLMPLMLVIMPLAMFPIFPTSEINLGNALIPVAGVMLLLRTVIEGDYLVALKFVLPASIVTGICCLLAIRWAVHQFNDESVLFRESERFSVRAWLRHLVRDRGVTPSLAEGFMAGVLLMILQFFARLVPPAPGRWSEFVISTLIIQLALVAFPAVLMAVVLTASPSRTLLLRFTRGTSLVAAVLLAVCLNPAASALQRFVQILYPLGPETTQQLAEVVRFITEAPMWQVLALLALTPAICEELAFRGFILSGLRHLGHKGMAILVTSLFFGIVHGMLQQSINACVLGMVLGFLAVQTGSILPCMLFHATHNALQIVSAVTFTSEFLQRHPSMTRFFVESSSVPESAVVFRAPIVVASVAASALLLRWFWSLPFSPTPEERLQEALDRQSAAAV